METQVENIDETKEETQDETKEETQMVTFHTSMHIIDRKTNSVENQQLDHEDAQRYIAGIVNEVMLDGNIKRYKTISDFTEVVTILKKLLINKTVDETERDVIANRLLKAEVAAQEKIEKLKNIEIKKGSLIQSFFSANHKFYFLLSKIESNTFLEESELIIKVGLPYGRKALKSCLFLIKPDGEIDEIYISDTNRNGTDYWYNSFLELQELTSDENNTKIVFTLMSDTIIKELKNYQADSILIRNQLLGYFKTNEDFNFTHAITHIFGDYIPQNKAVDLPALINKLQNKMKSRKFDMSFKIEQKVITERMWKFTKRLNEFSELSLSDYKSTIKDSIFSKEIGGEKYIIIKTTNDDAFNSFKWEEHKESI